LIIHEDLFLGFFIFVFIVLMPTEKAECTQTDNYGHDQETDFHESRPPLGKWDVPVPVSRLKATEGAVLLAGPGTALGTSATIPVGPAVATLFTAAATASAATAAA
jgi:hypothetical protein